MPSLLAAAFLWGCGTAQLILLSVVLDAHGMTAPVIAFVLSCMNVAMLFATLVAGIFASRFGASRTLILGGAISLVAIASLPFTLDCVLLAALATLARGFGVGLLNPAGQLFAQAIADEADRKRAIGMFTAMLLVPTFFGPAIAELALRNLGELSFFAMTVSPMILGLITATLLPRPNEEPAPPSAAGYLALLRDRRHWLPNLSAMQSGIIFNFGNSFLPLMLTSYTISVGDFFASFAAVLLLTRFIGMRYLQRLPNQWLMMIGFIAYAGEIAILATIGADVVMTGLAGALYGLGYGIIIPTAIDWSASYSPAAERARPIALINTSFHTGAIISMQLTGAILAIFNWLGVLAVLGAIVMTGFLVVAGDTVASRVGLRTAG